MTAFKHLDNSPDPYTNLTDLLYGWMTERESNEIGCEHIADDVLALWFEVGNMPGATEDQVVAFITEKVIPLVLGKQPKQNEVG
jgi:hypothetical protein